MCWWRGGWAVAGWRTIGAYMVGVSWVGGWWTVFGCCWCGGEWRCGELRDGVRGVNWRVCKVCKCIVGGVWVKYGGGR